MLQDKQEHHKPNFTPIISPCRQNLAFKPFNSSEYISSTGADFPGFAKLQPLPLSSHQQHSLQKFQQKESYYDTYHKMLDNENTLQFQFKKTDNGTKGQKQTTLDTNAQFNQDDYISSLNRNIDSDVPEGFSNIRTVKNRETYEHQIMQLQTQTDKNKRLPVILKNDEARKDVSQVQQDIIETTSYARFQAKDGRQDILVNFDEFLSVKSVCATEHKAKLSNKFSDVDKTNTMQEGIKERRFLFSHKKEDSTIQRKHSDEQTANSTVLNNFQKPQQDKLNPVILTDIKSTNIFIDDFKGSFQQSIAQQSQQSSQELSFLNKRRAARFNNPHIPQAEESQSSLISVSDEISKKFKEVSEARRDQYTSKLTKLDLGAMLTQIKSGYLQMTQDVFGQSHKSFQQKQEASEIYNKEQRYNLENQQLKAINIADKPEALSCKIVSLKSGSSSEITYFRKYKDQEIGLANMNMFQDLTPLSEDEDFNTDDEILNCGIVTAHQDYYPDQSLIMITPSENLTGFHNKYNDTDNNTLSLDSRNNNYGVSGSQENSMMQDPASLASFHKDNQQQLYQPFENTILEERDENVNSSRQTIISCLSDNLDVVNYKEDYESILHKQENQKAQNEPLRTVDTEQPLTMAQAITKQLESVNPYQSSTRNSEFNAKATNTATSNGNASQSMLSKYVMLQTYDTGLKTNQKKKHSASRQRHKSQNKSSANLINRQIRQPNQINVEIFINIKDSQSQQQLNLQDDNPKLSMTQRLDTSNQRMMEQTATQDFTNSFLNRASPIKHLGSSQLLQSQSSFRLDRSNVFMNTDQVSKKDLNDDDEDDCCVNQIDSKNNSNKKQNSVLNKNFQAQYMKMSNSLINNLQQGKNADIKLLLISDKDLIKFNERQASQEQRNKKFSGKNVFQGLYDNHKKTAEKMQEMRRSFESEQQIQEKKICTFYPQLKARRSYDHSRNRSPEQFYTEMINYRKNIDQKVDQMRVNSVQSVTKSLNLVHSKQNVRTSKLANTGAETENGDSPKLEVHERLYSLSKNKKPQHLNISLSSNNLLQNSVINIAHKKRDNDSLNRLYLAASRRSIELKSKQDKQTAASLKRSFSPPSLQVNEQILSGKIYKNIQLQYKKLCLTESNILNYHQLVVLLESLGYVNKAKASVQENNLLLSIWNSVKTRTYYNNNEQKEGITYHNFCMFMHVLNNIYSEKHMKNEKQNDQIIDEIRPFGFISSAGKFCVKSQIEATSIQRLFQQFIINHKANDLKQKQQNQQVAPITNKTKFTPILNKKSVAMVNKQVELLQKELSKQKIQYDCKEVLIQKGKMYEQRKRQQIQLNDSKVTEGCTFHLQTLQYESKRMSNNKSVTGLNRRRSPLNDSVTSRGQPTIHELLFDIAKSKQKQRTDRSTNDVEYDKAKGECTFKSNLISQAQPIANKSINNKYQLDSLNDDIFSQKTSLKSSFVAQDGVYVKQLETKVATKKSDYITGLPTQRVHKSKGSRILKKQLKLNTYLRLKLQGYENDYHKILFQDLTKNVEND